MSIQLDTNVDETTIEQWLAVRKEAALRIDPSTAEVDWAYGSIFDPYCIDPDLPEELRVAGRLYFARATGSDVWVSFSDLPEVIREALLQKHRDKLEYPAGLPPEFFRQRPG